jgi:N-sulfoglucosamine sulfohydrolase-like protein
MPHVPQSGFPADIKAMYPAGDRLHDYHCMITWLDRRIGELMGFLDAEGLRENTLVLFLNDNGNFLPRSKYVFSANGLRTPVLVSFPGVPPATRTEMVSSLDILPTMLDYAGVAAPYPLDGQSLRSLSEGRPTLWRRYLVNHVYNGEGSSIWNRDFTLYLEQGKVRKLYDLRIDPFEDTNLALPFGFEKEWAPVIETLEPVLASWWNDGVPPPLDPVNQGGGFIRGDVTGDGAVDLSDAIALLAALFGDGTLECASAADANDSGDLDISDPIRILFALFSGESIAAPFPGCGPDPTPDARLSCGRSCASQPASGPPRQSL